MPWPDSDKWWGVHAQVGRDESYCVIELCSTQAATMASEYLVFVLTGKICSIAFVEYVFWWKSCKGRLSTSLQGVNLSTGVCTNLGTGACAGLVPFLSHESASVPSACIVLMGKNKTMSWLPWLGLGMLTSQVPIQATFCSGNTCNVGPCSRTWLATRLRTLTCYLWLLCA